MILSGKVWGESLNIFTNQNFELHRIQVNKGGFCSKHYHEHKYNGFFIESGSLMISVWKDYDLVDKTFLKTGQFMVVSPGEYHKFLALEDTIAYEIYWGTFDPNDIKRETQGGKTE